MFFKTTEAKKNSLIEKQKEEEEGKEGGEEREPCDRCGSLEHVTCNRPG